MGFIQAILGGVFTILGAGSMFFIAYKALTIGNDVAEMKELLKQLRGSPGNGTGNTAAHSFPVPLDDYESHGLPNLSAVTSAAPKPEREFVLPPPISRRLDAERGIRRESEDDTRIRL